MRQLTNVIQFQRILEDLFKFNWAYTKGKGSMSLGDDVLKYLTEIRKGKAPVRNKKAFEAALRAPSTKTRELLKEGKKMHAKSARGGWTREQGTGKKGREGWRPRFGNKPDPYWATLGKQLQFYDEMSNPMISQLLKEGKQAGILPLLAMMAGGGAVAGGVASSG